MRIVQATEAKTRLAELLRAVERGERVAITRHGKTIAHLLPASDVDHKARREALVRFRSKRAKLASVSMTIQEILDARHEGHRA